MRGTKAKPKGTPKAKAPGIPEGEEEARPQSESEEGPAGAAAKGVCARAGEGGAAKRLMAKPHDPTPCPRDVYKRSFSDRLFCGRNSKAHRASTRKAERTAGTRPVSWGGEAATRPGRTGSPDPPPRDLNPHYYARRDAQGSHGRMGVGGDAVGGGGGRQADECERVFFVECSSRASEASGGCRRPSATTRSV